MLASLFSKHNGTHIGNNFIDVCGMMKTPTDANPTVECFCQHKTQYHKWGIALEILRCTCGNDNNTFTLAERQGRETQGQLGTHWGNTPCSVDRSASATGLCQQLFKLLQRQKVLSNRCDNPPQKWVLTTHTRMLTLFIHVDDTEHFNKLIGISSQTTK